MIHISDAIDMAMGKLNTRCASMQNRSDDMNRKTQPLTREQRRVLLLLRADQGPNAPKVTLRSLHRCGLITSDDPGAKLTDAGRARLEVKRGRKLGALTRAQREFAARQLALPLEVLA